jgi:hypothetical protein
LVVGETKSSAAELLAEYPVLLPEVADCVLLALIYPASNGNEHITVEDVVGASQTGSQVAEKNWLLR